MHFCDAILHLLFSLVPLDPGVKNRRTYFIQNLHPTHSYAIAFGEEIEHQMFGRGLSLCLSVYQCVSSAFVLLSTIAQLPSCQRVAVLVVVSYMEQTTRGQSLSTTPPFILVWRRRQTTKRAVSAVRHSPASRPIATAAWSLL